MFNIPESNIPRYRLTLKDLEQFKQSEIGIIRKQFADQENNNSHNKSGFQKKQNSNTNFIKRNIDAVSPNRNKKIKDRTTIDSKNIVGTKSIKNNNSIKVNDSTKVKQKNSLNGKKTIDTKTSYEGFLQHNKNLKKSYNQKQKIEHSKQLKSILNDVSDIYSQVMENKNISQGSGDKINNAIKFLGVYKSALRKQDKNNRMERLSSGSSAIDRSNQNDFIEKSNEVDSLIKDLKVVKEQLKHYEPVLSAPELAREAAMEYSKSKDAKQFYSRMKELNNLQDKQYDNISGMDKSQASINYSTEEKEILRILMKVEVDINSNIYPDDFSKNIQEVVNYKDSIIDVIDDSIAEGVSLDKRIIGERRMVNNFIDLVKEHKNGLNITDDTKEMMQNFQSRYNESTVLDDKPNTKLSSAKVEQVDVSTSKSRG